MKYEELLNKIFDKVTTVVNNLFVSGKFNQRYTRGAFGDITYRIDRDVENIILKLIHQELPNALIVTEEKGVIGDFENLPLVLIDPIDGSTNAIQNIPFFSSTVTILEGYYFDRIVAAGVADIIHGDRIISTEKGVVTLNNNVCSISNQQEIEKAYINMNIRTRSTKNSNWIISLMNNIRYPRFFGSSALETAYVAVGKSNAFIQVEPNLRSFDCIGALHLVKEAGGWIKFLNIEIEKVDLRKQERFAYIAASSRILGEKILSLKS